MDASELEEGQRLADELLNPPRHRSLYSVLLLLSKAEERLDFLAAFNAATEESMDYLTNREEHREHWEAYVGR